LIDIATIKIVTIQYYLHNKWKLTNYLISIIIINKTWNHTISNSKACLLYLHVFI